MKRCPKCRRDYYDDTLSFCLDDGSRLVDGPASFGVPPSGGFSIDPRDDEPATAILSEPGAAATGFRPDGESSESKTAILAHAGAEAEPQKVLGEPSERQSLSAHQTAKPQGKVGSRQRQLAGFGIAVLLLVGGFFSYRYFKPTGTEQINSIAVLPFQNKSGDPNSEYLSDGLAESLIYRLSQLPNLKVSPTSSVIQYKGKDTKVATIASELGVDAVMTGRLAQIGDNLTISVELVDVRNNKLLWGEQYERKMSELLATQREIATEITNKLQLKLSGEDTKGLTKRYTDNNEAYQLYLKGTYHYAKRTRSDILKGIDYFQQAIELDPNFALAYAMTASAYNSMAKNPELSPKEAIPQAKAAAKRALEIDPALAEAHAALADSLAIFDWNWAESEREFKRAIELNPNVSYTHLSYGLSYLVAMGRTDEAVMEMKRAVELEPLSLINNSVLVGGFLYARQNEKALEQARKTYDLDPNFGLGQYWLGEAYLANGMNDDAISLSEKVLERVPYAQAILSLAGQAYAKSGRRREAEQFIDRLREVAKTQYVRPNWIAAVYVALGDKNEAFAELEKAYAEHDAYLPRMKADPQLDPLRDDPRFKDLLKRMNLPE